MKLIRVGLAAVLALAVGATGLALEKHDRDDDSRHGRGHERDWDDRHDHGRHEGWEKHDHRREHDVHYVRYEERGGRHWIPEEHFRAHFGREHWFIIERPVVVAGHPRFQYDGYWFVIARPLPPGLRYSDRVYVDYYDDNYYMCSPVHPGVRIAVNVVL